MPRVKDWKPGEFRIEVKIINEKGNKLDYYMPHLIPRQGLSMIILCTSLAGNHVGLIRTIFRNKWAREVFGNVIEALPKGGSK